MLEITGLSRLVLWLWPVSDWLTLAAEAAVISLVFLLTAYLLLSPAERMELKERIAHRGKSAPSVA
jgi:hypothetical protein